MFYGAPHHYLLAMQLAELRPVESLAWPALCRYVRRYRPQAWLPAVESIAFFQLGALREVLRLSGQGKTIEAWLGTTASIFWQPETQRHFASLRLARVSRESLGRLISLFQDVIAAGYEEAWRRERRRWRGGAEERAFAPPGWLDMTEVLAVHPSFSRLTANFPASPLQVFDLLWLDKTLDWEQEALIHVYA